MKCMCWEIMGAFLRVARGRSKSRDRELVGTGCELVCRENIL